MAAVMPPVVAMRGDLPGQAGPARGRPLGAHAARPGTPAARAELPPGVRRALARRRQAADAVGPPRPLQLPQPRGRRPRHRRRPGPPPEALELRARAGGLAGRVPPVPRRGQAAPRGQAQADARPPRDRRAARPPPRRRPGLDRRRQPGRLLRILPPQPARRADQPAPARDRPRPPAPRPDPRPAVRRRSSIRSARRSSTASSAASARRWSGSTRKLAAGELPAARRPPS